MAAPVVEILGSDEEEELRAKARGRPRLADTDRVRRRLESRKKYDCRRVYLGEVHGAWVLRRERGGGGATETGEEPWSDAKLAAYLLALERHGKPCDSLQTGKLPPKIRRRRCVNSLLSLATWYHAHRTHCPHEPALSELDASHVVYTTAVWQCQEGHRYFQDLRCPLKAMNQRGCDDGASSDDSSSSSPPVEQSPEVYHLAHPLHTGFPHLSESVVESGAQTSESSETVVCVPIGSEEGGLFGGVSQEDLGHVVAASCPSQVIIIAGPGYEALTAEGIQLNVADGDSEEHETCTAMEAVTAYTRTHPRKTRHLVTVEEEDEEEETEFCPQQVVTAGHASEIYHHVAYDESLHEQDDDDDEDDDDDDPEFVEDPDYTSDYTPQPQKEPAKKRRRPDRVRNEDGVIEMYHCQYEGCSQVYRALSSFQNHVNLVHKKGRTKVCTEPGCGKSFYLTNHLRRHMLIHTGERDFICETCGKSFKRKSHLQVHKRTHTGETPLQCEVCGYQCKQRASLNWHRRKHREEINYSFSCEYCGKRFEKKESVKFHKLKSHPEEKPTEATAGGAHTLTS